MVDAVITVPDDDQGSACGAIDKCLEIADEVIFCNGGDRGTTNKTMNDIKKLLQLSHTGTSKDKANGRSKHRNTSIRYRSLVLDTI